MQTCCRHGIVLNSVMVVVKNELGKQLSMEHSENYITYEDAMSLVRITNKEESIALEKWLFMDILPLVNQYGLHNASLLWDTELAMNDIVAHVEREKPYVNEFGELVS